MSAPQLPACLARLGRSTVHCPKNAIQPRILTIPCNLLYLFANSMLPFPMFTLSLEGFSSQFNPSPSPSPDFSSLRSSSPSRRSTVALAPRPFPRFVFFSKLFGIRTHEKRACKSRRIRTSKTRHLKSFRICSYKKKGGAPRLYRPYITRNPTMDLSPSGHRKLVDLCEPRLNSASGTVMRILNLRCSMRPVEESVGYHTRTNHTPSERIPPPLVRLLSIILGGGSTRWIQKSVRN